MEVAFRGVRKVLCVAEKNDAAKGIADLLSNGRMRRKEGLSKFNKIYEFDYHLYGKVECYYDNDFSLWTFAGSRFPDEVSEMAELQSPSPL